ncbi:MAG: flagellar hook-basal body complex protein [bacterium]|nr:flagellar hook-basal body complex protein [bacterium]
MGIFSAMNTAITGLNAQSAALEHISNNIANSQTVGYKRTETSFSELVQESNPRKQALGVVAASSRATNDIQGQTQSSSMDTHFAINGTGYFIVSEQQSTVDGEPVFGSDSLYTRRGDFELDASGYLVNSTGYYLKGLALNPDTGNQSGSVPELIKISGDFLPAKATTEIDYILNLPSQPVTSAADSQVANSELLNTASFSSDPTIAGTGIVTGDDAEEFIDQSISGGSVTSYNATGVPANIEFRWAKTDSVQAGGTDSWELFYLSDSDATGSDEAWTNAGQVYAFGSDGELDPGIDSITLSSVSVNGVALGDIDIDHTSGEVTQYSTIDGTARTTVQQNGYTAGEFVSVALSDDGRINANYSNGGIIPISSIALANFPASNSLAKTNGGAFRETASSGVPSFTTIGSIVSGALESSNTDIADEFSKLIITQQAYAANTRIVSTGDEMMQETLNMVR